MDGGYNYDSGSDVEEFMEGFAMGYVEESSGDVEEFMEGGYKYDAGSDVEGIFPEEFRKYDRAITDGFESTVDTNITGTEQCLVQFLRAQQVIGDFGERRFRLTSRNQPFIFMTTTFDKTPFSEGGMCSYRMKMVDFITGDGGGGGVIGHVFRNKRMEFTPNIGYYSYAEYSDRDLALSCHIKSCLAIPLSDSSGRSVGVIDIVSSVELNGVAQYCFSHLLLCLLGYWDCCRKGKRVQYASLKMAVSEIKEVMQLVSRSCCLVYAQIWMLCNRCSCLRLDGNLGGFNEHGYLEYNYWANLYTLKKGEGVVGKAATSAHNLVYCDNVSQFSITEYPLAHLARYHKLTACFATCLRSNRTGNQIYVLEFFLNPSKVNGSGPRSMLVPIL